MCNSIDDLGFSQSEQEQAKPEQDSFDWAQATVTLRDNLANGTGLDLVKREQLKNMDESEPNVFVRYVAMYKLAEGLIGATAVEGFPSISEATAAWLSKYPNSIAGDIAEFETVSLSEIQDEQDRREIMRLIRRVTPDLAQADEDDDQDYLTGCGGDDLEDEDECDELGECDEDYDDDDDNFVPGKDEDYIVR